MLSLPLVVLKHDKALGTYCSVEVELVELLQKFLQDANVRFAFDPPSARPLSEPAKCIFAFGEWPPYRLGDLLMNGDWEVSLDADLSSTEDSYALAASQLLTLGPPPEGENRLDYLALGIGPRDVPELVRMALDEELFAANANGNGFWAHIHACRALGQLRAETAVAPLLTLLRRIEDEEASWIEDEVVDLCGRIGPAAIPALYQYLGSPARDWVARKAAAAALVHVVHSHPEARGQCIGLLCAQLELFQTNSSTLNAFLITPLVDMQAVEAAPLIEKVFDSGRVDEEAFGGSLEDAQIDMGLKKDTQEPPAILKELFAESNPPSPPKCRRRNSKRRF
jgi:hypothetical protein